MRVYELIVTNESIGKVDIYDNTNAYVATLKNKDLTNNEYVKLLIREVNKWYVASITCEKITLSIQIK